jgi:hypothetical protein
VTSGIPIRDSAQIDGSIEDDLSDPGKADEDADSQTKLTGEICYYCLGPRCDCLDPGSCPCFDQAGERKVDNGRLDFYFHDRIRLL